MRTVWSSADDVSGLCKGIQGDSHLGVNIYKVKTVFESIFKLVFNIKPAIIGLPVELNTIQCDVIYRSLLTTLHLLFVLIISYFTLRTNSQVSKVMQFFCLSIRTGSLAEM